MMRKWLMQREAYADAVIMMDGDDSKIKIE